MVVSVIIPTYEEAETIFGILTRTMQVLGAVHIPYEIIVVDESPSEATTLKAKEILKNNGQVIRRIVQQRSLSLSVLEGIDRANGDTIVIMDADGSHPPELIPEFFRYLGLGYDLVIASRYIRGAEAIGCSLKRKIAYYGACILGRMVTTVRDNTSGYFCIKRSCLEQVKLVPRGFKIGLEIFVKARYSRYKEIPYVFSSRKKGKSKFGSKVMLQYVLQIIDLLRYRNQNHLNIIDKASLRGKL